MVFIFVQLFATLVCLEFLPLIAAMDLKGDYELSMGPSTCTTRLAISANGTDLPAEAISANGTQCTGGAIKMAPLSVENDPSFQAIFSTVGVAESKILKPNATMVCGDHVILASSRLYVFRMADSGSALASSIMAVLSDLSPQIEKFFTSLMGRSYIVDSTGCIYTKESAEEAESDSPSEMLADACFPASAVVTLRSGVKTRMDQLRIGDQVHIGLGQFSPVFAWTHRDPQFMSRTYTRLTANNCSEVTLTPGHFVYANGRAVAAEDVKVGDEMIGGHGEKFWVTDAASVTSHGLYNPQTIHGDIVVDGFRVTTYTSSMHSTTAHALLAPLRALFVAGCSMPS